ncbi:hypothetical protein O0I10_006150 [Lichtheimia ornata]|uniref:Very-long-chain (3R)-3-hydroxyacyl-CoA dehydratase n=1 Tax=Lichtheimia ornata TaxID=688661 RepID=A0AAD7V2G9_9FUNG|nr:uncharacterized protein O0I10_006150 [Lichtheimia ornata]KAJ8658143.1 hypothetical protein O0I10_006150 [Lichtheimia ornata]
MPQGKQSSGGGLTNVYLLAYNGASFFGWFMILFTTVSCLINNNGDYTKVHSLVWPWLQVVQTTAIMEVIHSLVGFVRAPVTTTAMQVASRLFLVWGVNYMFPAIGTHVSFSTMMIAWSIAECVRYSYYATNLLGSVPGFLNWARYNLFFVLYPMGVGSELTMVYQSLPYAQEWNPLYFYFLIGTSLVYLPGFPVLFLHMVSQRRKYMKSSQEKKRQ